MRPSRKGLISKLIVTVDAELCHFQRIFLMLVSVGLVGLVCNPHLPKGPSQVLAAEDIEEEFEITS